MKKIKVVIIENCKDFCDIIMFYVQTRFSDSIEITGIAYDGISGINLLKSNKPDIAIIDIILPKISGYELVSILKSHNETKHIKCILISNMDDESFSLKAKEVGTNMFLIKPFELNVICSAIRYSDTL